MKILIVTVGTRGDVEPYIALGQALREAAHEVTICTCSHFERVIREHGLEYAYINNDFIDFMHTPEGKIILGNAGSLWKTLITVIPLLSRLGQLQQRQMDDVWQACKTSASDLILYHMKAAGVPDFAEKLGVPCMLAFWLPLHVPTTEAPAMGFPNLPLGPGYRWLTYQIIRRIMVLAGKRIKKWRSQHGLPSRSNGLRMQLPNGNPIPTLHGFSRHLIPRPSDWPASATVTGYWFLDQTEDWTPPTALTDFLSADKPPIYIGFGSIFGRDPQKVTNIILEAVQRCGVRAILARGWGGIELDDFNLPDSIMVIDSVPHRWLFPQVAAVIHHGGCGTTAAGLLAGKPTLICPFFGDQPFWGQQVARLGVGPPPIPQTKLSVQLLCQAIEALLSDTKMRENAAALGRKISQENGTANAVAFIHQWMREYSE